MRLVITALLFILSFSVYSNNDTLVLPVLYVIDGDTIKADFRLLPEPLNKVSIRIASIDTPEKGHRAKCDKEHDLSMVAKKALEDLLKPHTSIMVRNYKWGAYGGRIVGEVYVSTTNVGHWMVSNGYADGNYDYKDGKSGKKDWCN